MYTFVAPYNPGLQAPWPGAQQQWMGGGGPGPAPWTGGGGGGGGKGKKASAFASKEAYFAPTLRPEDSEAYTAAGLLLYRKGDNGIEVLVASEKPWNPLANEYDPLAWNTIGGKKTPWTGEWDAPATAARCLMEVFGGCEEAPTSQKIVDMCQEAPVLWYPAGRFALFVREFQSEDGEVFDEAPKSFGAAKEKGAYPFSPEEQRVNSKGQPTTRWVKQIEALEWVLAADLTASEPRSPLTDLLKNICLVGAFQQFLQEGTAPEPPPKVPEGGRKGGKDAKGGGKKGGAGSGAGGWQDGGKKGGGGGGKKGAGGGKGKGGCMKGKGMPYAGYAPMPPPPMTPQMYPVEMQRQMLGEKLYMTVQPMVNSPITAQKVTGMLLELPMPELMPLLGPGPEERNMLQQRVDEALEVLESEQQA